MSVRKGDRAEGKLQVLELAEKLCIHSLQKCKNEKCFPKSQRWLLTQKIADEATNALICIRKANVTYPDGSEERYQYRREKQTEAHASLGALYALVDVAHQMNSGLDGDATEYWTKLIRDTDQKLQAWMRSDKERSQGQQNIK